jgi:hypothetical protein
MHTSTRRSPSLLYPCEVSACMIFKSSSFCLFITFFVAPPNVPRPLGATYTSDGTGIFITFDSATNKASTAIRDSTASFQCSLLIIFQGSSTSQCMWLSNSSLFVVPSNILQLGYPLTIRSSVIQAACVSNTNCAAYAFVPSTTLNISVPTLPLAPIPQLSAPSAVSLCDSLVLDPTASSGKVLNVWLSVRWSVAAAAGSLISNITLENLSLFFRNVTDTTDVVVIPSSLLTTGVFVFQLQVVNFFKVSGQASVQVSVEADSNKPQLRIAGITSNIFFRWQSLTLTSSLKFPPCAPGLIRNLAITWKVFKVIFEYKHLVLALF